MRWRRYVNLVALIGMLMHAGMIVRHHQVMLDAHLERQNLITALGVICHGNGQASAPYEAELPWVPPTSDDQNSQCPLCAGLTSAFAVTASVTQGVPVQFQAVAPQIVRYAARPIEVARVRPPSRGPPHIA